MISSVTYLSPHQRAQLNAAAYLRQKNHLRAKAQAQRTERVKTVVAFVVLAVLWFLVAMIARYQLNGAAAAKVQSAPSGLALYANPTAAIDRQIELATR